MKYLSIDVGYANLGWCVFEIVDDNFTYLSSGYIGENDKKSYPKEFTKRLKFIYDYLKNIIETCNVNALVYEKPYMNGRGDVGAKVTNVVGILLLLCAMFNLRDYDYTAKQVKKAISGDGEAGKQKVDDSVCQFLNLKLEFKTDHESDAVAVGITHFKAR